MINYATNPIKEVDARNRIKVSVIIALCWIAKIVVYNKRLRQQGKNIMGNVLQYRMNIAFINDERLNETLIPQA